MTTRTGRRGPPALLSSPTSTLRVRWSQSLVRAVTATTTISEGSMNSQNTGSQRLRARSAEATRAQGTMTSSSLRTPVTSATPSHRRSHVLCA
jgi:hypothetical protein